MNIRAQPHARAWASSASLAASGSATSGSFVSQGYARLVGLFIASASMVAGSGLRIFQSADRGANWDYWTDYAPSACSGSAFSIEVVGDAMKVEVRNGLTDASLLRTVWMLRPV